MPYLPVDFALTRSNWVYRMFDVHGECLYVGKSVATKRHPDGQYLMQRLAQHLTGTNPWHRKPWRHEVSRIDATAFDTWQEAKAGESLMIKRLRPEYSTAGKPLGGTLAGMEY